ncbi:MAG TPA: TMEM165/GDT1 family protein [Kineosporiaceae bacterium]|nr:TMEM165/GDT1 family protein [Kineosporiaceae bacterium]
MVYAFLLSFGVIFIAELGDKSQLMAMTLASRYKPWPILAGITVATATIHAASVLIGSIAGQSLSTDWITLVAGIAFIGFAGWTLRGDTLTSDDEAAAARARRSAFITATIVFFIAELGDKTMLATITLATREGMFGTWLGSTVGMVAADALAIGIGALLGRNLPERVIRIGASSLFMIFGALLIIEGIQALA